MDGDYKYYAFISYSHKDARWAKWVQDAVEHYKLPAIIRKEAKEPLPKKLSPVFRDATHLGAGKLVNNLHSELDASKFLIVICSPSAANPNAEGKHFVDSEVRHFCELGRADRIIPVIVEGTPETSFCPKIKEEEILALDATKFPKARIQNDIVARLLGLRPDDLWKRELRRRRRQCVIRGCAIFLTGLVTAFGGWYWHDWNAGKIAYFKDYVDRFGVPQGLFPLERGNIKGRGRTYKFHYRGYDGILPWTRKPILRKMFCVNSFEMPVVDDRGLPLHETVAGIEFRYDDKGMIREKLFLLVNGEVASRWLIGHTDVSETIDVLRRGLDGRLGTSRLSTVAENGKPMKDLPSRFAVIRDTSGFIREVSFQKGSEGTATSVDGVDKVRYKPDAMGRISEAMACAWDGKPVVDQDDGGDLVRCEYSPEGDLCRKTVFKAGEIVSIEEFLHDMYGNRTCERRYDGTQNPLATKEGWSERRFEYDSDGEVVKTLHFSPEGKLSERSDSVIARTVKYENGRVSEDDVRYFHADNERGADGEGHSRVVRRFDSCGLPVEIRYWGKDGNPLSSVQMRYSPNILQHCGTSWFDAEGKSMLAPNEGWSSWRKKIEPISESGGCRISMSWTGVDGKPVLTGMNRCAREVATTDVQGNTVSIELFGMGDERIAGSNGWQTVRFEYDKFGFLARTSYYDVEGKPVAAAGFDGIALPDRVHAMKRVNDALGNTLEFSAWGVDGSLADIPSLGYAREVRRYDDKRRPVEVEFYDRNGNKALSRKGYCGWKIAIAHDDSQTGGKVVKVYSLDGGYTRNQFDGRGLMLSESYFNADGSPRPDSLGIAAVLRKFDADGRMIKKGFLGVDGKRTLSEEKIAGWECVYDGRGKKTEERYFGTDGKLTEGADGVAIVRWQYDSDGRMTGKDFFNALTNRCLNKAGAGGVRWEYDSKGNRTAEYNIDKNGKAMKDENGVHVVRFVFDKNGRESGRMFFDGDGQRVKSNDGISGWNSEYDTAGNETKRTYVDEAGIPCLSISEGTAGWKTAYDNDGRMVERSAFGVNRKPMAFAFRGPIGIVQLDRMLFRYGRDGEVVVTAILPNGESVLGVGRIVVTTNRKGYMTSLEYTDRTGRPMNTKLGFGRKVIEYNSYGEVSEESYWDASGRPTLSPEGAHRATIGYKRGEFGLEIDLRNFDTENFPVMCTNGISRCIKRYDRIGRQIYQEYRDDRNRPVVPPGQMFASCSLTHDGNGRLSRIAIQNSDTKALNGAREILFDYSLVDSGRIRVKALDASGEVVKSLEASFAEVWPLLQLGRVRYTLDVNRRPSEYIYMGE